MTLAEMADFVTEKVRMTDQAAVALAKDFLRRRYEMIWAEALWRDALEIVTFTFTPGRTDATLSLIDNVRTSANGIWVAPASVDRIMSIRSSLRMLVVDNDEALMMNVLDAYAQSGPAVNFSVLPACVGFNNSDADALSLSFAVAPAVASTIVVGWTNATGEQFRTEYSVKNATALDSTLARVDSISKPTTETALLLTSALGTLLTLGPAAGIAPRRTAARLFPVPIVATDFRALVKKKADSLLADEDTPGLRGVENALLAFVQADLLERGRQYAKAAQVQQEAVALLAQLKTVETLQQSNRVRIQPVMGLNESLPWNGAEALGPYWLAPKSIW